MSRQRASGVFGCIAGLLACAVLLAPAAVATPESEAADAITATWTANGGDGGALGPRNGEVYPVGEGFGQNFAGGKIFFTPATGARVMRGAILEKYESLGGPADSDLGFPTIDEGPGRAPESLNTTFSASDKPVIFWTPATGARVVRGPINAAWDKLGGSSGRLGVPAEDEAYRGDLVTQRFTGGEVSYNTVDKTFTTVPPELAGELAGLAVPDDPTTAINAARRAAGGALGPLGAAQGEPYEIGDNGLGQNFAGGKIFYTPATGAHVVTGQVLAKYESVGGPEGDLGFPTTGEEAGGAGDGKMTSFSAEDKPVIFWTPDYGAVIVRGAMNAAWQKLDAASGTLGAPMADETEDGEVVTQRFSGGVVSWDRSKESFTTEPANLASQLAGLEVPGQQTPETPEQPAAPNDDGGDRFGFSWWWLLGLIPILVLIGLVVFATQRRRGRDAEDDDRFGFDEPAFARDEAGMFTSVGAPERAAGPDDYSATLFGDRYAREGMGAFSAPAGEADRAEDSVWGAPHTDSVAEPAAPEPEGDEDPDNVDTTPTRVPTVVERDPLTDTGRHARIEIDEPDQPPRTAFRLALDDFGDAPEGYPVKADTKTGMYYTPGSAGYDEAQAEIWFSSEEFARTNGFVPGG